MIVKNEQETLNRCLNSCYSLFDEIVIVDTGSQDNTKEIAKKFTDKVLDFKWCNDFSKARNFAILNTSCEYFMWLDADDVITEANLKKLKSLKENINNEDFFMLKYDISFDKNDIPTFSYFRERICKRNDKNLFHDPVHEAIQIYGNIKYLDISIQHRKVKANEKERNLKIYEDLIKQKVKFTDRQQFYYSRELFYNNKINKAIVNFKKFLKSSTGFIENKIEACENLSRCYLIKNDYLKAKQVLFNSFIYDLPRAEILCGLGYIYEAEGNYNKAIYYFKLALKAEINLNSGAFVRTDYYNYIPYLELCVCYFQLGDINKAEYYNNLALKLKPNEEIPNKNKDILNSLK
jgi:glycosyltransferase involved in cell wall biosynthesis